MSYRIGVISDTHGLLRDEVREHLQGCDRIFHAGDIDNPSMVAELNRIAPTYFVRGNTDREWAKDIPEIQVMDDIGPWVLMIHNRKHLDRDLKQYDLIIYGHSHRYEEKQIDGRTWLNPGSCGPRRFRLPVTMAMLHIEDGGRFRIERIDIRLTEPQNTFVSSAETVKEYLPAIMRDIDKGATVDQVAKRYRLSKELAEQICRLYLTHPGVDADGIMRKLGI